MWTRRMPVAVLIATLLSGCSYEGPWLQVWWGDVDAQADPVTFEAGDASAIAGLVFEHPLGDDTAHGIVLTGSWAPASCDIYTDHMRELDALRTEAEGIPLDADGAAWVCERLAGLALEAYGGDGGHRSVHALVGAGAFADPRIAPAPQDLALAADGTLDSDSLPGLGTYVARVLEWGDPQLPETDDEGADRCTAAVLAAWAVPESTAGDGVHAGAFRRYDHRYTAEPAVARTGGDPATVGYSTEGWASPMSGDATTLATVFTDAPAIAGSSYPQMVAGTDGESIVLEPCPTAAGAVGWSFPELSATAEAER